MIRSEEAIQKVWIKSIKPTIARLMTELSVCDDIFLKKELLLGSDSMSVPVTTETEIDSMIQVNPHFLMGELSFKYRLSGYKKSKEKQFAVECKVIWQFSEFTYDFFIVHINKPEPYRLLYDRFYEEDDFLNIVRKCGNQMFEQIDQNRTRQ